MTSICLGMGNEEKNKEIKLIAVKALRDAMGFLEKAFETENVRNYVVNLLLETCNHQDTEIRITAL